MDDPAIVVLACRRIDELTNLLNALSALPDVAAFSLYVSFGCPESLNATGFQSPLPAVRFLQYADPGDTPPPPFLRIQLHYQFVLRELFERRHHSHVLLLEDDLQLSPDLLPFLRQTNALLAADASLVCVSAFNDHALGENADPRLLKRSSFFPNLGLLFPRRGYDALWKDQPLDATTNGWDHWLRIRAASLRLECLFPVAPRVRHVVSANSSTVSRALAARLQAYPLVQESRVDLGDLSYLLRTNYERSLLRLFVHPDDQSRVLRGMALDPHRSLAGGPSLPDNRVRYLACDLQDPEVVVVPGKSGREAAVALRYHERVVVIPTRREWFSQLSYRFRLFSSFRGAHRGILWISRQDTEILFIDARNGWYALPREDALLPNPAGVFVSGDKGETCKSACWRQNAVCNPKQLEFGNDCNVMKAHFPCEKGCWNEVGVDIPAYVNDGKGYDGMCLVSVDSFPSCEASNPNTRRLCYCIPKEPSHSL
ncbi:hypothetical protein WA538_005134 [Blastocystis sp. DL]